MVQLIIHSTAKGYHRSSEWRQFDRRIETFNDRKEAMEWIKENYLGKKRSPMYCDTKEGTKKVGYVIGFRNSGWGSSSQDNWLQQDWISFREVKDLTI